MSNLLAIGLSAAAPLIGMGMNAIGHNLQLEQQQHFQDQAIRGNKEMMDYAQKKSMQTWEQTNYEAQRKQMEKAGLNVGLMYGGTGSGGTTSTSTAGGIQSGTPNKPSEVMGMGIQMASQLALMNAQKENIEADTRNKIADAKVKGVTVPNVEADTSNKQQQTKLAEYNTQIAKIRSEIETEGKSLQLGTLNQMWNKLKADTGLAEASKAKIEQEIINLGVTRILMNSNILKNQADVELNKAKIDEISAKIAQGWKGLELEGSRVGQNASQIAINAAQLGLNAIKNEFETGTGAEVKRLLDGIGGIFSNTAGGYKNFKSPIKRVPGGK